MHTSSLVVDKARELAAAGHHAAVVEYLGAREVSELEDSPSLALLYGTAQARLGHHDEGLRWLDLALDQARKQDEQPVERHALNARGAAPGSSGDSRVPRRAGAGAARAGPGSGDPQQPVRSRRRDRGSANRGVAAGGRPPADGCRAGVA